MTGAYRVQVTAGAYSWDVTEGDAPAYGLADPLVVSWQFPTGAVRPAQPEPMVLQFTVIAPTAETVGDLGIGALVTAEVTFGTGGGYPVRFIGRITDAAAEVVALGVLYRFTASDITTDLAALDVGVGVSGIASAYWHLADRTTAAGLYMGDNADDWATFGWYYLDLYLDQLFTDYSEVIGGSGAGGITGPWMDKETLDGADLLSNLVAWSDQIGAKSPDFPDTYFRPVLTGFPWDWPGGVNAFGAPYRWALAPVPDRTIYTAVPATFGLRPGGWGPVLPAVSVPSAGYLSGCRIAADARWQGTARNDTTRAAVTILTATSFVSERIPDTIARVENPLPGRPPATVRRDTITLAVSDGSGTVATATANASNVAHLMIPAQIETARLWAPESFTWLLADDAAGLDDFPALFPDFTVDWRALDTTPVPCYSLNLTLGDVLGDWNVATPGAEIFTGQLTRAEVRIESGRPMVTMTLDPLPVPSSAAPGVLLTWAGVPSPVPAWNVLDPLPSWTEYRLVGP